MNNLRIKVFGAIFYFVASIASAGVFAPLESFVPPEGWQKERDGDVIFISKNETNFLLYAVRYTKDSKSFFQDVRSEIFGDEVKCEDPEIKSDPMLSEYVIMSCINFGGQSGLATYGRVEELGAAVVMMIRASSDENLNILLKKVLPAVGNFFKKAAEEVMEGNN